MLHQKRSKQVKKFKYLLMVPMILGMLVYTSCEQETASTQPSPVEGLHPELQKYYHEYKSMISSNEDIIQLMKELNRETPDGELMSEDNFYRSNALWILNQEHFNEAVGLSEGLKKELSRLGGQSYEEYLETMKQRKEDHKQPVHTFSNISEKPSFQVPCEEGKDPFTCFKEQLNDHVRNTFQYPVEAREKGIQGRVYVNFKIDTDGSVTVLNTRAPHELLDAEARRIIESLPKLNPGKKADGTAVPITFAYPIIFKLGDGAETDSGSVVVKNDVAGSSEVPFTVIPVKPSFKTPCEDGQEAFACFIEKLNAHVMDTFRYPEEAKAAGIEGKVYLNFRIDTDGTVKVLNSRAPHELLDAEARRIIEALPSLNPGGNENGDPVPVSFAYPIVFKL